MSADTETQKLACKLSQGESEAKMHALVLAEQDESKQKEAKKAVVAQLNSQLKQVRALIDKLVGELAKGAEEREVPVEAVFDYEAKRVDYKRLDTGEVIDSRDMDAMDLQEKLPGHEGNVLPPPSVPQKRTRKRKHGELQDMAPEGD